MWTTTRPDTAEHAADVAVVGGSVAGLAAALALRDAGLRVALVDRQAAPAWEAGWSFALEAGTGDDPAWSRLAAAWGAAGALDGGRIAGAVAEVASAGLIADAGIEWLAYRTPVAVERDRTGALAAALFAGKSGFARLRAPRWIDASEDGELARLHDPALAPAPAAASRILIAWQRERWADQGLDLGRIDGAGALRWQPGRWASERQLVLDLPGDGAGFRRWWLPMLDRLQAAVGGELEAAQASHASWLPLPLWAGARPVEGAVVRGSLALAVPGRCGLAADTAAARAALGAAAARAVLAAAPAGEPAGRALAVPQAELGAAVAVAGLGTAGALAALAAARAGAAVTACEPLPGPGGMGTAGGVHAYYFGVRGGLQDEVDAAVDALRGRFGAPARQFGFHPLAKLAVLDRLLAEAGVQVRCGATVCAVQSEGGVIRRALLATPQGPLALAAPAWIDGTGDGDLAAMAGTRFRLGRAADAMVHAYTQSSGRCRPVEGGVRLDGVNFDSGYCDPTDPADFARARLQGILQYRRARTDGWDRPTYIAPAIGLRESRLVDTDRVLGMAELIEGANGDDAIALHGAHLDAHAVDMHNESDELVFWIWGCRQWGRHRTSGGIPYGCLLPAGIANLWLAGRCLGVSHDAHYSLRMQRELQRVGEAAGVAAALAAASGRASRAVSPAEVRARLAPGALEARDDAQAHPFGWIQPRRFFGRDLSAPRDEAGLAALAAGLGADEGGHDIRFADAGAGQPTPGLDMWRLYRAGARAVPHLLPLLAEADGMRSWRAACVLAALGRGEAAPRLIRAIEVRQGGFERWDPARGPDDSRSHVALDWITACALLRCCAGWEAVPALAGAAADPALPFDAGVAIAATLARIARRHPPIPAQVAAAQAVLDALQARFSGAVPLPPHRTVNRPAAETLAAGKRETAEDHAWQLQLAVAEARRACGLAPQPALQALAADPRAHVRRAAALHLAPVRRAAAG